MLQVICQDTWSNIHIRYTQNCLFCKLKTFVDNFIMFLIYFWYITDWTKGKNILTDYVIISTCQALEKQNKSFIGIIELVLLRYYCFITHRIYLIKSLPLFILDSQGLCSLDSPLHVTRPHLEVYDFLSFDEGRQGTSILRERVWF